MRPSDIEYTYMYYHWIALKKRVKQKTKKCLIYSTYTTRYKTKHTSSPHNRDRGR